MVGWHHLLNGHELEQTPGDGEGQGSRHTAAHGIPPLFVLQKQSKHHLETSIHQQKFRKANHQQENEWHIIKQEIQMAYKHVKKHSNSGNQDTN